MARWKQIGVDIDVHRAIEGARRSFAESENEILRRLLLAPDARKRAQPPAAIEVERAPGPVRTRGRWSVVRQGAPCVASNLKDAYRTALVLLDAEFPDFLERFAHEKARTRRFVARSPVQLYLASPKLARRHAKPLVDGWFFDTNLSTAQVARRIRIAARMCGLRYGPDLSIMNNLEEI